MAEQIAVEPRIDDFSPVARPVVQDLLTRVPRGEYLFLKDDIADPDVMDRWLAQDAAHVFLAYLEDDLVGLLAVIRGIGWSSHVGEFRMVVDPAARGRGVGTALARRGLVAAMRAGLKKVSVEILAEQEAVAALFARLAFTPEALLVDHVMDDQGQLHDLLVLSHPVDETWSTLETIGIAEGVTVR